MNIFQCACVDDHHEDPPIDLSESHSSVITNQLVMMHYNLGCSLQEQGKLEEAVTCYRNALAVDHFHSDIHYNLANALQLLGRTAEAEEEYFITLHQNPKHHLAYYNLGYTYLNDLKDPAKSITMFKKALEIAPEDIDAQLNLAIALNELGRLDDVIYCYEYIIEHHSDCVLAHFNLANAYLDAGRIEDALEHFRRVVLLDPCHADAYYNMAIIYQTRASGETRYEDLERALRCFEAVQQAGSEVDGALLTDVQRAAADIARKLDK